MRKAKIWAVHYTVLVESRSAREPGKYPQGRDCWVVAATVQDAIAEVYREFATEDNGLAIDSVTPKGTKDLLIVGE
jgi:hypothetical protein